MALIIKKRLDLLVSEKENISRAKAQALIMSGTVFVNGKKLDKPGSQITESAAIEIKKKFPYVSRGALKLEKAAQEFGIDFTEKAVCDIGASTGGFTDFALQRGAKKVYAIDSGYGQLDQKLRHDSRVINMERTNIKKVDSLPEPIDIFTVDVSFISLKQVLPQVVTIIRNSSFGIRHSSDAVALIKPQFEVGKKIADKFKGVIKDQKIQTEVVEDIGKFVESIGFKVQGLTESPITGAKGNKEFLIFLTF